MERTPKKKQQMCHICSKKGKDSSAVCVCLDCSPAPKYICGSCVETHNIWFDDHQTQTVAEFSEERQQEMCSIHAAEKATHVCTGCKAVMCAACETAGRCTAKKVRKHTCVQIHVYLEQLKAQLHLTIGACVKNRCALEEEIEACNSKQLSVETDKISEDIDSHTEDIIRKVRHLMSENKREAQVSHEKKQEFVKKSLEKLTDLKESNAKGQQICEKVMKSRSIANVREALDNVKAYRKEVPPQEVCEVGVRFGVPAASKVDAKLKAVTGHIISSKFAALRTITVEWPHELCRKDMFEGVIFNEAIPLTSGRYLEVLNAKLYQVDKKGWSIPIGNAAVKCFCISHDRLKGYTADGRYIYQYDLDEETGTLSGKMEYASNYTGQSARSLRISSLNQLAVLCDKKVLVYENGELKQTVSSSSMGVQLFDSPTSVTWSTDGKKLLVADSTDRIGPSSCIVSLLLDPPNIKWETRSGLHTDPINYLLCMDEFIYAVSSPKEGSTHQIYALKADTGELVKKESGKGRVCGLSNNQGTVQVFVHSSL